MKMTRDKLPASGSPVHAPDAHARVHRSSVFVPDSNGHHICPGNRTSNGSMYYSLLVAPHLSVNAPSVRVELKTGTASSEPRVSERRAGVRVTAGGPGPGWSQVSPPGLREHSPRQAGPAPGPMSSPL